jgi:PAS domain S-box-containing protein
MNAAISAVMPEHASLRILVLDETWVAALTAGGFDLVVTDYVMHWTDGLEVLKTLKARYPECPVIMVTGTGNEEVAVAAMKLGLDEYVVKSVLHHRRLPNVVRAVLERRRAAELEDRLATLTDALEVGVYRKTLDGGLLDCNAAFRRLADRWAAGDPALLANRLCCAPELAAVASHLVLGPQPVYEVAIAGPHGEQHWLSARRVLTSRGADTIVDGFVTDVTAQHQTLEQLRQSEARNRSILDSLREAHITADGSGTIIQVNPAAVRLFGYREEDLIGQSVAKLVAPAYESPHVQQRMHEASTCDRDIIRGARVYEDGGLRKDGTRFPVDVIVNRISTNAGIYLNAIVRDLTEERAASATLRLLHEAMEAAFDAVVVTDKHSVLIYCNGAFTRITGLTLSEMQGRMVYQMLIEQGLMDLSREDYRKARGFDASWTGRLLLTLPDGTKQIQNVVTTPVLDEHGTIIHYVAVWRNVSAEVDLQQQLLRAQKLEAVGQLAAGIAHEINTPIQFVGDNLRFLGETFEELQTLCQSLREISHSADGRDAPSATLAAALDNAETSYLFTEGPRAVTQSLEGINRVARIVRAMKDFSHPGQSLMEMDLNRAIESTITISSNEWKYVAMIETDFDAELPVVPVLPGEFNQVILNMIVNAAHAIADVVGDGSADKGRIRVTTRRQESSAEITIEDTGAGIPEEIRHRIFDPFFTTKAVGKGTGQGLAIAHNVIVEKHRGSISVASEPGAGTCFTIRLPLQRAAKDADAEAADGES